MMKRTLPFLALLAILSIVSGCLMADASWIGRVGITLFHKAYNLLKIWWQGAAAVFILLLLLFVLHTYIFNKLPAVAARVSHVFLLMLPCEFLYLTYSDFQTNFSHRLLGWHFHYGVYLFWVDWMLICLYFLFAKKPANEVTDPGNKETTVD